MSTPDEHDRPTWPGIDDEPTEVDPPREDMPSADDILVDLEPVYRPAWAEHLARNHIT